MASGTIETNIVNQYLKLIGEWSSKQNTAGNYSDVTVTVYIYIGANGSMSVSSRTNNYVSDGTASHKFSTSAINKGAGKHQIGKKTFRVNHDNDGKKSFNLSLTWNALATLNGVYFTNITASGNVTLDTIPRASSITKFEAYANSSDIYLNDDINWSIKSASNNFRHVLRIFRNNGTLASRDISANTKNGVIKLSQAEKEIFLGWSETWTNAEVVAELTTYDGNTKIGDTQRFSPERYLYINASDYTPTIGNLTYKDTNANVTNLTGSNQNLVQSKSDLEVKVSQVTANGKSKIQRVTASIENSSRSKTFNAITTGVVTLDFNKINVDKSAYVVITAVDARGFTATKKVWVGIFPYSKPKFVLYEAERKNAFEASSYLNFKIRHSPIVENSMEYKYWYKYPNFSTYDDSEEITSIVSIENDGGERFGILRRHYMGDFSNDSSLMIKIEAKDYFGTYFQELVLNQASGIAEIDKNGLAFKEDIKFDKEIIDKNDNEVIGLGGTIVIMMVKKLINTVVKIGLGVVLNGIIEDYSDYYIKLENGLLIQWGTSVSSNPAAGVTQRYPIPYKNNPMIFTQSVWNSAWNYTATVYQEYPDDFKWRAWVGGGSGMNTTATIRYLAIGKWK